MMVFCYYYYQCQNQPMLDLGKLQKQLHNCVELYNIISQVDGLGLK